MWKKIENDAEMSYLCKGHDYELLKYVKSWTPGQCLKFQAIILPTFGGFDGAYVIPKPQNRQNNSPKPLKTAIRAIISHTFGVQVVLQSPDG